MDKLQGKSLRVHRNFVAHKILKKYPDSDYCNREGKLPKVNVRRAHIKRNLCQHF
jgi:hypothetical protein